MLKREFNSVIYLIKRERVLREGVKNKRERIRGRDREGGKPVEEAGHPAVPAPGRQRQADL